MVRAPSPRRSRSSAASTSSSVRDMRDHPGEIEVTLDRELRERREVGCDVARAVIRRRGCPCRTGTRSLEGRPRPLSRRSPTTTAVAPGRIASQASRIVSGTPTTSNAWSAPPSGQGVDRTRRACFGRGVDDVMRRRARARARASPRRGRRPRSAPPRRAWPPRAPGGQRRRARRSPRSPLAEHARRCAPRRIPVTTPHPSSAACQSGNSSGSGIAPAAETTARSAKHAVWSPCWRGLPSGRLSREVPSISIPARLFLPASSQRFEPTSQACLTGPAGRHEAEHHPVAGAESRDAVDRPPPRRPPPRDRGPSASDRCRARRRRDGGRSGRPLPRPRARGPRPRQEERARRPRCGRRPARAAPPRASWRHSCDAPPLERLEIELDAEAGALGWRDRAVRRDGERLGEQPVAALRAPGGRVIRGPRSTARSSTR